MDDDLVERIMTEDALNLRCVRMQIDEREPIFAEAAARIATLTAERDTLRRILRAILAADERGQGLPFAEAMDAAAGALTAKDNPDG